MKSNPKIAVFGLPYSPNVGDGVISDCIESEIIKILPAAEVVKIDLSGRTGIGTSQINRELALKVLNTFPKPMRSRVVSLIMGRKLRRIEQEWNDRLVGVDAVLIGGGQLFSDVDLNFPLKIAAVADLASRIKCPVAVIGAGVADNWSSKGRRLFQKLTETDCRAVGLRDIASVTTWNKLNANSRLNNARLCRDPGLLASDCYDLSVNDEEMGDRSNAPVGIGVSDAEEIALHSDTHSLKQDQLLMRFCDIILGLAKNGERIQIFSNGAVRDHVFADLVFNSDRLSELRKEGTLSLCEKPKTGEELASQIAQCKSILAYRLHACIVAWSLQIPFTGIRWDKKLDSFANSVNLSGNIVEIQDDSAQIVNLIRQTSQTGYDPIEHARIQAEVRDQIRHIISDLGLMT